MAQQDEEWYKRLEGIIHSYKQHIDILNADTERSETIDNRAMLEVDFEIDEDHMDDSKRALFVGRLFREDNVWVSRLGCDSAVLVKRQ